MPLRPELVDELRALRHARPYVFNPVADQPLSYRTAHQRITAIAKEAGIRHVSWHPLRHTIATNLTLNKVSLRVVQELLGHADIRTTERYAHVATATMRASLDELSYAARVTSGDVKSRHQTPISVDNLTAIHAMPVGNEAGSSLRKAQSPA